MADPLSYRHESTDLDDPARNALSVTPDDGTDLSQISRAIYVGGAGNLTVNMADTGSSILFANIPAGTVLPIRVSRVLATGTAATNILALY